VSVGGELNGAPEVRREQMIRAALEVIQERGFPDTRIADVAQRAGVSPALVIYYFGTKDSLLTEAMRYSEDAFYDLGARRMAAASSAKARLEEIVALNCLPTDEDEVGDSWTLWLDLWAQAARNPAVARVREEFDEHWRETIRTIVREGQASGEFGAIDADDFAVGFSALLDGLAIQIALEDPVVDGRRAFELSMRVAATQLGFEWSSERCPTPSPGSKPTGHRAAARPRQRS
jgi:AcrR family transcriptional regulator